MTENSDGLDSPILSNKHYASPSEFTPESLLREARRQKRLTKAKVPPICVLDPDGDIVRFLLATDNAERDPSWACYHSELYRFVHKNQEFGIVGCAVGASYAVLIAEQLFASGCELLISITSSGQITSLGTPPYFILIDRALRDEGTSYHYLPPSEFSEADALLAEAVWPRLSETGERIERGATWTTDAPFRETTEAIDVARAKGIMAVEMEAAGLYAFAEARQKPVLCFAHVTNQMGRTEGDFEKGEQNGAVAAVTLIGVIADAWRDHCE
jgi:uridine phosphorylase